MIYKWKAPAIVKTDAQTAGEMCEELSRTVGLTPKNLLDANRADDAPLHDEFEWNDSTAAENWREEQAARIIRFLVVEPEPEKECVRAFVSVVTEIHSYMPLNVVVSRPDLRAQMLERAFSELQAFQKKYANLQELEPVFDAAKVVEDRCDV